MYTFAINLIVSLALIFSRKYKTPVINPGNTCTSMTRWAPVSLFVLLQATALVFSSVPTKVPLDRVHQAQYQIIFEKGDETFNFVKPTDVTTTAHDQRSVNSTTDEQKSIKSRMSVDSLCNSNDTQLPHMTPPSHSTTTTTVTDTTPWIFTEYLTPSDEKTQTSTTVLKEKKRKRSGSQQTRRSYSRQKSDSNITATQATSTTTTTTSGTFSNTSTSQPLAIQPRARLQRDYSDRNAIINHAWLQSFRSHPSWKALLLLNLKTMVSTDDMASLFSAVGLLLEDMVAYEETLISFFSHLLTYGHFEIYTELCKAYCMQYSKMPLIVSRNLTTILTQTFVTLFEWLDNALPNFAAQVYQTVTMNHIAHWEQSKYSQLIRDLSHDSTPDKLRETLVVGLTKAHAPRLALEMASTMSNVERQDQLMSSVVYYVALNDCHPCLYHYWAYSPAKKSGFTNVPEMIRSIYGKYPKILPPAIGAQTYHTTDALCVPLETGFDLSFDTRLAIDIDDVDSYSASLGPSFVWTNALLEQHATYAVSRGSIEILAHLFASYETIQVSESVRIAKDIFLHSLKLENKIRAVPTNRFTSQPLEWLLVDLHDSAAWSFCFKDVVQWAAEEVQTERTELKPQLYVLMQRNPSLQQTLGEATYASRKAALDDLLIDYHRSIARYASSLRSTH